MSTTAQQVYAENVRGLPPAERLRLATLILNDLTRAGNLPRVVDASHSWSEQDQNDLTAFSLQYATTLYREDEELG